jgi:hypothetical protein
VTSISALTRSVTLAAVLGGAVAAAAPALAAKPPLLKTATAYTSGESKHGVSVTLVTSATDPKRIQPGGAPLGSQFAAGGIYARCPAAPRSGTAEPFTGIPFPALTLRLSHGHYGFSKRLQVTQFLVASTLRASVKLTVLFTGTVLKQTLIAGTVKITGKQCATTAKYTAKPSSNLQVAPGQ